MPVRKNYEPMNQPTQAMATGVGAPPPGMPMIPQAGRTGPQMPMPMAGSSRAQPTPMPEMPLPMGPGGPLSPMNAQSQGMLAPDRSPSRVPMDLGDMFGGGGGGGQAGGPLDAMGGSSGGMEPQVLMRLMKLLGQI